MRETSIQQVAAKYGQQMYHIHIAAGKLYLSPILNLHNRETVSFNISKSSNFEQIKDMLKQAFDKYDNLEGLKFHSNQGWQYQMKIEFNNRYLGKGTI